MYTIPKIEGVKLQVYKQDRLLTPEDDGHVGQLFSGFATILAVIDPSADKTIGIFRDGQDHYTQQRELLSLPELRHGKFPPTPAQQFMRKLLAEQSLDQDAKAYGVKIPLHVYPYQGKPINMVNYPENTLSLAQYVSENRGLTGRVQVWEVALVSQYGEFFLTVHRHYNIAACKSIRGHRYFPRLTRGHPLLERILLENAPQDLPLIPGEDLIPFERGHPDKSLGRYEGIVESWYAPRNMGAITTAQGSARVHWNDVPPRPRLRYLKEGERVKFNDLRVPPKNPGTDHRKIRQASRFQLQVCGVEVAA